MLHDQPPLLVNYPPTHKWWIGVFRNSNHQIITSELTLWVGFVIVFTFGCITGYLFGNQ